MSFTESQLQELSSLIDTFQALPEAEQETWLKALPDDKAVYLDSLRRLLGAGSGRETADFLSTLPKFFGLDDDPAAGLEPGIEIGPYRIVSELGRGGMGTVWLAERIDGTLKRPVALKLPHGALANRQLVERFARERDMLAALNHANIARLYDAGVTAQGQPYLALEVVEGVPLPHYCDAHCMDIGRRLQLFEQVMAAVQYAHSQLIVHRDLKPTNILVTSAGEVKLLDFGIAKLLTDGQARETELTQAGGRALTPDYASPEQIAGGTIGTASDVYALGVVLYELLTGSRPYRLKRDTRGALEEAILNVGPVWPSQVDIDQAKATARSSSTKKLVRQLTGDLDTIILKALKKNPAERYGTVEAFAQDLARYQCGEAVLARPDSVWYRAGKFLSRNWISAGAVAAVVVALATGLGIALWQASVARQETQTAKAVQDFLRDIFQANSSNQSDPKKARLTTARELLDIGASRVDRALAGAPKAKSEVLRTLGDLYLDIGEQAKAVEIHRKRMAVVRQVSAAGSSELADAAVSLCHVLEQDFSPPVMAERKGLLDEAERILDRRGDHGTELRARLLYQQGFLLLGSDMGQAYAYMARAIEIYRRLPPNAAGIETIADAAQALERTGRFSEAKSLLEEALQMAQAVGNGANAVLPQIHTTLGNILFQQGDRRAAVLAHRKAFETAGALNSPNHETFYMSGSSYGNILMRTSQPKEGLAVLKLAFDAAVAARGVDDHMFVQNVAYQYGDALGNIGRVEEGLKLVTRAIEHLPGPRDHSSFVHWFESQAALLTILGRYEEAAALFKETRRTREKSEGPSPDMQEHFSGQLPLLLATGRAKEALAQLRELPQLKSAEPGTNGLLLLANAELAAGELGAATKHASAALSEIRSSQWPELLKNKQVGAERVIGNALLAQGNATEALAHLAHAVELEIDLVDIERSPDLADLYIVLGQCELALGHRTAAQSRLDAARAIHRTHSQLGQHLRRPLAELAAALGGKASGRNSDTPGAGHKPGPANF